MTLEFDLRPTFGHDRYYPLNNAAAVLVALAGRKCFNVEDLERLKAVGFEVLVKGQSDSIEEFKLTNERGQGRR